ncbi:hypothetical protein QJQ45_002452 [Haematococcus lacustris]|nr:hypothetical protein QJQ45_002452 [Haematococcus lacustris]
MLPPGCYLRISGGIPHTVWVVCRPRGTDQRRGRVVLVDELRTSRVSLAVNGQQPNESRLSKRKPTSPTDRKPPAGQVEHRLVRPAWSQQRDQPWHHASPHRPHAAAIQPAASEPGPSTPLPAKRSKHNKAEQAAEPTQPTKGKAAKAKPAPQPGRWVDRDCNAALNMQRIGESRWRPLELCWSPEQGKLPAKGKEYPGLGYKRLRDKPPKAQQQQSAAAQCTHTSPRNPHSTRQPHRPSASPPAKRSKRTKAEQAAEPTQRTNDKGKVKGKVDTAKPALQPGRWVDRDCNAALNMQRIEESKWHPLELCWWPDLPALPTKGKEYSKLGCKRLRDRSLKAQ